jgi:glycogen debranching enzyme
MSNAPEADLLPGDVVLSFEQVLSQDDPVFDPNTRLDFSTALELSSGKVGNWLVPFASGTLDHHTGIRDQNLFRCLFGRDSLVISSLLQHMNPQLQMETVCALAQHQGLEPNPASEEEFGRIAHEVRDPFDPQAMKISSEAGWLFPYYGSVDATLLWLVALGELAKREPKILERVIAGKTLANRAEDATSWVLFRLDSGAGYIRSQRSNPKGILNQVWKDSGDSYITSSGQVALQQGTASVETIGESYDALLAASEIAKLSESSWAITPAELVGRAEKLKVDLLENWWVSDYFAMGMGIIDGVETLLDAVASNQWRLLDSSILDDPACSKYVTQMIDSVTDSEILGPNGIRTLGISNPRYRPGGYHTGSSWPVDSALVTRGLLRHGAVNQALEVGNRAVAAINAVGGYPELFRSDQSERAGVSRFIVDVLDPVTNSVNRICQPPQLLQGWTIAAYGWFTKNGITGKLTSL